MFYFTSPLKMLKVQPTEITFHLIKKKTISLYFKCLTTYSHMSETEILQLSFSSVVSTLYSMYLFTFCMLNLTDLIIVTMTSEKIERFITFYTM